MCSRDTLTGRDVTEPLAVLPCLWPYPAEAKEGYPARPLAG